MTALETTAGLDVAAWRRANDVYLGAAVGWARERLAELAEPPVAAPPESSGGAARSRAADARRAMDDARRIEPPPAVDVLAALFGLSAFEVDVLVLCLAAELDSRVPGLCAVANGDAHRAAVTCSLAMAASPAPEWAAISPSAPLRYWHLVDVDTAVVGPFTAAPLRLDERILHFAKGLNTFDESLLGVIAPVEVAAVVAPSQDVVVDAIADGWRPGVVMLVGPNTAAIRNVAASAAARHGCLLHEISLHALSAGDGLARRWQRETRLWPVALYTDASDHDVTPAIVAALRRWGAEAATPVLVGVREAVASLANDGPTHDVATPTPSEQRRLWQDVVDDATAAQRAAALDLDVTEIARGDARSARVELDGLAQRIDTTASWDDLVLPAEPLRLLRTIAEQAHHRSLVYDDWGWRERRSRGLGITALFSGESGVGKTLAAEVLATELGVDLYRIDLAGVVSKYIGETEKNLRRVFDAAERAGALLFFDEADALFGKRSEVRDSHDRYANIEIDYLLTRMEAYRGLAVLATNVRQALDPAFTRRLRFIVAFPFPGAVERRRIWELAFPPGAPQADLDWDRLARLNLSGGSIAAVALNAAFLAAARGSAIDTDAVLDAVRIELRKLERPLSEVDAR
jgi:hypothetical protein